VDDIDRKEPDICRTTDVEPSQRLSIKNRRLTLRINPRQTCGPIRDKPTHHPFSAMGRYVFEAFSNLCGLFLPKRSHRVV
jgi:hypothetical protein